MTKTLLDGKNKVNDQSIIKGEDGLKTLFRHFRNHNVYLSCILCTILTDINTSVK